MNHPRTFPNIKINKTTIYLLLYLRSEVLEEHFDLPGSPAVEREAPLTAAPAGPAEPPGEAGPTVRAEDEATVGQVESGGLDLAGRPPAEVAVKPHGRHPVLWPHAVVLT